MADPRSAGVRVTQDHRTWRQRVTAAEENWRPLMPALVEAYLAQQSGNAPAPEVPPEGGDQITIDIYDIYTL